MDIQLYAALLLLVRIGSMTLMGAVLLRQIQLFELPIAKDIKHFRVVLFVLALCIFFGNFIPAGIDILTITGDLARSTKTVNTVSLIYTAATSLTSLLSAYLIFRLYRLEIGRAHV